MEEQEFTLLTLLNHIYDEIKDRNETVNLGGVPMTDEFNKYLEKKYNLVPEKIPELIEILKKSKKIFSFSVVEENSEKNVAKVNGLVITKGDLLLKLKTVYSDELIRLYAYEFNLKLPIEKIIKDMIAKMTKYNNTDVAKTANIVMSLAHYEGYLERNILKFSKKIQDSDLEDSIKNSDPLSFYLKKKEDEQSEGETTKTSQNNLQNQTQKAHKKLERRAADSPHGHDIQSLSNKAHIIKAIEVYGVGFYTRICFRDYHFTIIKKVIDEGLINKVDDLKVVKKLVDTVRANSDKDENIQKYAAEINMLIKTINQKIK